jgi:ABC-type multidrug transport system fused ATPase/permease subunit
VSQAGADLLVGELGSGSRRDRLHFRLIVRLLVRCLHLLWPVRGHLALLFLGFSALALIFVPVGILLMDAFWTRVLQGAALTAAQASLLQLDPAVFGGAGALGPEERREVLLRTIAVGLALGLAATPCSFALYYYRVWILQRVNQILRMRMMERLQSLSLRFHAESRIGDAIYRMVQDSAMVTQLIDVLVIAPLGMLGRYLFCVLVVAFFDPGLALLLAALWPPLLLAGYWFSRRLRVRFRAAREANAALTSRIQETLQGIKVIKAYGAESIEQARFEADSRAAFDAAFSARGLLAVFVVLLFWVAVSAVVASTAMAAVKTLEGDGVLIAAFGFSAWTLGLFNYFKTRFGDGAGQLRQLFRTWGRTQDIAIGLDRVFELLDLEPEVADAPDAILSRGSAGDPLSERALRYQPDRPALESTSFEAQVGTITAIVGPTDPGEDHADGALAASSIPSRVRSRSTGSTSASSRSRACARGWRSPCRRTCSSEPRCARTSATPLRTRATSRCGRPPGSPAPARSSSSFPKATTRCSGNGAPSSPPASASASRSPGRS